MLEPLPCPAHLHLLTMWCASHTQDMRRFHRLRRHCRRLRLLRTAIISTVANTVAAAAVASAIPIPIAATAIATAIAAAALAAAAVTTAAFTTAFVTVADAVIASLPQSALTCTRGGLLRCVRAVWSVKRWSVQCN